MRKKKRMRFSLPQRVDRISPGEPVVIQPSPRLTDADIVLYIDLQTYLKSLDMSQVIDYLWECAQ